MSKLSQQSGFSLIELLVTLFLSLGLILGVTAAYSSIAGLIQAGKNIENAQEVLRYSSEIFSRSLKQTSVFPTITTSTLTVEQEVGSIACDGSRPSADYTEAFTLVGNHLKCDVGSGSGAQSILTGVENISFSSNEKLISITVTPKAQRGETAGVGPAKAVQIDIALSEIIIKNAMGL